jgi:hypothetical protein
MARIRKQDDFKLFKGNKHAQRSNKVKRKKEEDNKPVYNEDVLDRLRYLGSI